MSDEMKPREFWIDSIMNFDRPHTKTAYIYEQDAEKIKGYVTHVIEKSAYDELQRKLEIAKRALGNLSSRVAFYAETGLIECFTVSGSGPSLSNVLDDCEDALKEIEK